MKRWKKVVLVIISLAALSQFPFIYRRYQLGRLQSTIDMLNAGRIATDSDDSYADHKGVMHVHSHLGGHSTGAFEEIVAGAKSNGLAFVIMTEHPAKYINTAKVTLKGWHDGVLFIPGSEINAADADRLLVVPGLTPLDSSAQPPSTQRVIDEAKQRGSLVFVAYPEQIRSWDLQDYDGIEVYNLYSNTKKINYARLFFDGLWSYRSYPHLLFSTFYARPDDNLKKWDELMTTQNKKLVAVAGNDAHANVGLSFQHLTGEKILRIKLDPYERSFRTVRVHVLTEKTQLLDAEAALSALARGNCFIGFDVFTDSSGFRFTAENGIEKKIMGDEIELTNRDVSLSVSSPVKSRVVFFRDGEIILEEKEVVRKVLRVNRKGIYRVEAYLDQLGEPLNARPWIISNPIYVR